MPWGFKVVMTERWAVSPQLHLAALVVWRVVEHRPALVSKCCWSASAMSPGVVSCQKRDAERWDLCSSLKCHVNLWSAATVLYLVGFLTSLTSGMLLRWEQATVLPTSRAGWESWEMETHGLCAGGLQWVSQSLLTRASVPARDLLEPAKVLLLSPHSSCQFPLIRKSFPDQEWGNSHSPS